MMYNIVTGYAGMRQYPSSEIAIMISSLRRIAELGLTAVYTDRHAYLSSAHFFSSLDSLDQIAWGPLQHRDFRRDVDNPDKIEQYQAEALIHQHLPVEQLSAIVCYSETEKQVLEEKRRKYGLKIPITVYPRWYFD